MMNLLFLFIEDHLSSNVDYAKIWLDKPKLTDIHCKCFVVSSIC